MNARSRRSASADRMQRIIIGGVGAILAGVVGIGLYAALGGGGAAFEEGRDYRELATRLTPADGPIVVHEFFSYGCPHCYDFDPHLEEWEEELPDDVRLEREPLGFNASWRVLAEAYFAFEQTGMTEEMHQAVFAGLHDRGDRRLYTREGLVALVDGRTERGAMFERALDSRTVETRTAQAEQLANAAGIRSVPSLMVDGRWVLESARLGHADLLRLAEELIARAREERSGTAPAAD
jgi:thiol:disulfide interchange protein DsbA